jgi:hypothetical protein
MRVRFWGTRGSIASPGPGTNYFGGNTSCVELTTANGDLLETSPAYFFPNRYGGVEGSS